MEIHPIESRDFFIYGLNILNNIWKDVINVGATIFTVEQMWTVPIIYFALFHIMVYLPFQFMVYSAQFLALFWCFDTVAWKYVREANEDNGYIHLNGNITIKNHKPQLLKTALEKHLTNTIYISIPVVVVHMTYTINHYEIDPRILIILAVSGAGINLARLAILEANIALDSCLYTNVQSPISPPAVTTSQLDQKQNIIMSPKNSIDFKMKRKVFDITTQHMGKKSRTAIAYSWYLAKYSLRYSIAKVLLHVGSDSQNSQAQMIPVNESS